mmetsp:Transcript_13210/g.20596  ORF Transcript_13210/g.20596 Transcript_13210/m.20596 type:complete len:162 (+) Transcript_13210:295-780(+)
MNKDHFNQLQVNRYTLSYPSVPKSLFQKFVTKVYLDPSKCESFSIKDIEPGTYEHSLRGFTPGTSVQELNIEVNVKNQNQNTGGRAAKVNEAFKFTCQRYHCYITQIIEHLKNWELALQMGAPEKEIDTDFSFVPSVQGLGSKVKGAQKAAVSTKAKSSIN